MKIKHLIKKLQALNPEANVYTSDEYGITFPVAYVVLGTCIKQKQFVRQADVDSTDPSRQEAVRIQVKRFGTDVLISNWNGEY